MADSSNVNSEDILQQIREQTSELETGEVQEETLETSEPQEEQVEEPGEEQPAETSQTQEETEQEAAQTTETETPMRIKYKGRDIDIPHEKIREYVQKGYKVEDTMRDLREKEQALTTRVQQTQQIDVSKLNDEFVKNLQENPLGTLMELNKMTIEQARQEEIRQRKMDRAVEKEMRQNIPHWDAISDIYHEHRDEGHDHKTALLLAERDMFANLYLDSKQKGVEEGVQKATLKQKADVLSGKNKKGAAPNENAFSAGDIKNMTSDQMLKEIFGGRITRNPNW